MSISRLLFSSSLFFFVCLACVEFPAVELVTMVST